MRARIGQRRARAALALLGATAVLGVVASAALGTTATLGTLQISIDGKITPSHLSKTKPTPITLKLNGAIKTTDGSHVPAAKTLTMEFDKHGYLYTKGLPTCRTSQLESTLTAQAKKACGKALVGEGRASAEIAFPEQPPFSASGPMLIFNGQPQGRNPVLIIHVHANVPAPTTFVTKGVISKGHGKYGTKAVIQVPTIVGGAGSLTSFEATLHKTWTYKGQKRSLLYATCPKGSLVAHGEFEFVNGTKLSGEIAKHC